MSPEMLTWRAVERCDHDENYPGVCDFCYALAMAEVLVEEEPELCREAPKVHDAKTIPQIERIILADCHEVLKEIAETEIHFETITQGPHA